MENLLIGLVVGVLLGGAVAYLLLHLRILSPLRKLRELTGHLDELDAEELNERAEQIAGTPGDVARAIAAYTETAAAEAISKGTGGASAESAYKMRVVDEICRSLLPQPLKDNIASMTFSLAGGLQQGTRRNCDFYDYFFLDEKTLCLAVGQVPGNGIAEALFAVVAQTTIRSRLRMGRTLVETMSDVNAQLYDLGGMNTVNVLVGVLNTVNGRFGFVNAGGAVPFLMRSEERYEWLQTPVYAPLGANESVSYRSETLRLNQGDRMFLYTADLGDMKNREEERFSEREFQSALNRSRTKARSMEELLRYVQDEAAAFCEKEEDVLCSTAIALEYKKGNKDYIFTLVRGAPEYAPDVTEFMRRTLEEGGIPPRERAKQILLADELFALCCRSCKEEADVKVECAILPDENTIHLRMFAPMDGRDPLSAIETPAGESAANYIRTHTKRVAFEAGIERDMIEIISDLGTEKA